MVKKTPNRLKTDMRREIRRTRNRFFSLFVLSALAVAFLAGLRTTAPDMHYTADLYYDESNMMDVQIFSNLGLTQEDLDAVKSYSGISDAEGSKSFDAILDDSTVTVSSLPERIDTLTVTEGRLPQAEDECVTEQALLNANKLKLGDTITLDISDHDDALTRRTFTIVGVVHSPLYISISHGSSSIGTGSVTALVYLPRSVFTWDYYTAIYATVDGMKDLLCYGDEYENKMDDFLDAMGPFGDTRAQLRHDQIVGDAEDTLADAQKQYDDKKAEADQKLADAAQELSDARKKLDDGWAQLKDGRAQLKQTQAEKTALLRKTHDTLTSSSDEYYSGLEQYNTGLKQYQEQQAQWQTQQDAVTAGYAQYEQALSAYQEGTPEYAAAAAQLAEQKATLDASQTKLNEAKQQLSGAKATLDATKAQLDAAKTQLDSGWDQYDKGVAALQKAVDEGNAKLDQSEQTLNDGEKDYQDGLAEYESSKAEADTKLADARQKLTDAQSEIDDIKAGEWYVLGRSSNMGYVNYQQDSQRMSNLADVFPIIFFVVAALACLTTMTRMVEEQRTQIGCLKALGFSRRAISVKYIGYAFFASFLGGVVGLAVGCTLIPWVIVNAWDIMYTTTDLHLLFQPVICVLAVAFAIAATVGASVWACISTLTDTPANLMRPKSPKAGKRVLLERVKPVWSRLNFIQKVTARNLLRYKRRFWMTVIGIGGCTALLVTGFGLRDSIFDILDKQFGEISLYDATVGLSDDITGDELSAVTGFLDGQSDVAGYLSSYEKQQDVTANGNVLENVYLFAVSDQDRFGQFIDLHHRKDGSRVTIPSEGAVITEKMSELLGVGVGDTITLDGDQKVTVKITDIAENYVYHYIYISEDYYSQLFGAPPVHNTLMVTYTDDTEAVSDNISRQLMKMDGVTSYSRIGTIRQQFTDSLQSINYAVMIITVSAAALAFVVLYNLTNINITERRRELATLKVLGFYDRETSAYVYRENMVLTVLGIALGLGMGKLLHAWLIKTVEINMVMFGREASGISYVWAMVLTAVFSVLVNFIAHFSLKKLDMVESLKTME